MRFAVTTILVLLGAASAFAAEFLNNGATAHRGNSSEFPENTIPAFQSGIEVGADWIELDILRTKDGQLVVAHDRTTKRVGDRDLPVAESTYEELATVDVATDFRRRTGKTVEESPPQPMPLLADVLRLVMKQDGTRVSIQPKMDCVAEAVDLVRSMKCERWVGFNDGNLEYMATVKRLAPDIPVFWDRGKDTDIAADIAIAKRHGFEALVLHHAGVTPEKVRMIKSAGIEAGAWTVNDRATMRRLLEMGIERIYTDHPRRLLSLNSRRGGHEKPSDDPGRQLLGRGRAPPRGGLDRPSWNAEGKAPAPSSASHLYERRNGWPIRPARSAGSSCRRIGSDVVRRMLESVYFLSRSGRPVFRASEPVLPTIEA